MCSLASRDVDLSTRVETIRTTFDLFPRDCLRAHVGGKHAPASVCVCEREKGCSTGPVVTTLTLTKYHRPARLSLQV